VGNSSVSQNVSALLTKRFNIYKRDKVGLVCEVIVPFIMVLLGSALTMLDLTKATDPVTLSPNAYPNPQYILMNTNAVHVSDPTVTPSMLYDNLPEGSTSFDVSYTDTENFVAFYGDVYADRNRHVTPYHYGSYQVYCAD
jgi:hypothetical protein